MARFFRLLILIALVSSYLSVQTSYATNYYTYTSAATTGAWNVAGTWTTDPSGVSLTGSAVPSNGDAVFILNGYTVFLTANVATTGLSVNISNGGTLDLSTFTMASLNALSGAGTMKIKSGYFPTVTTNSFISSAASGATVEYYDFDGNVPSSVNFPNLRFSNRTNTNHTIALSNTTAYTLSVFGNLTTEATGSGALSVLLGTQITNIISMSVSGSITIGANSTLAVGNFNAIHSISVSGNMTNNGTVDLSNGTQYAASTTGAATLRFLGASDNILACNGLTDLYTLTVDKGTSSTNILSVTSTSTANLNFYFNGTLLNITNGTLRLGANINIPRLNGGGNYDVGTSTTSPMLWVDGAAVNSNSSALVIYGKFRITAGSFTTVNGEGSVIREEGQYIIEGGTFTTEKFRPSNTSDNHRGSFIMTGGTFNAQGTGSSAVYARFSLPYPEQVFIMSGGVINVSDPEESVGATSGGIHIGAKAANYSITGGTFNAILSGTAPAFHILSTAPFYNLNILRTGGTPTVAQLSNISGSATMTTTAQPLQVLNDFSISGVNTPTFDANGLNVTIGGNFIINSGATYISTTNTTTFNGTADQAFNNSGTITSGLSNLTVNKTSGTLTLGGSAGEFVITQTLILTRGILNDGGKIVRVTGNIYNQATHTGTGNITLSGTATQTLSGDGNGVYGNVILDNGSSPGVTAAASLTISGTLTLAGTGNSLFDINQYTLSLTSAGASALTSTGNGFSGTKMIRTLGLQSDGGIKKTFGNLDAFTYAFGAGTNYTPATIQLTAAPTSYGTITVKPVNSRNPFVVLGNTNNLTWYWRAVSANFVGASTYSHSYQYLDANVAPAGDDANYVPARYTPTTWTVINNTTQVNETTNVISFTNVTYIDGDFTAGIPSAFGTVKVFYSKRNGNWSDTGPGTTPWSNVSHTGPDATTSPTAGDYVYIGDGTTYNHIITIIANGASSGGLEINAGSTLDVGTFTGHNFGALLDAPVAGSGTLRISSATATAQFPAGDFGNFIRTSGGTVVYYSTGTQNFTIPLSSDSPTLLPLITYRNLVLAPGTGRSIIMPNQDIRIYDNLTVQGASATGVARLTNIAARTLTVNGSLNISSGALEFQNDAAQAVAVNGNVSVSSGAFLQIAATGAMVTNTMTLDGSLVNNGTFDMSNGTHFCNVTFQNAANASVTGTGTTTDFNILTVSKGTSITPVLEVNATAFSLSGGALPLVLSNGTFRLTSSQTVTFATGADFNIPATARLSANGGTLDMTGGSGFDLLLAGTLEVLSGTVNIGTTANDNSIEYAATGVPTIDVSGAGILNIHGQVRRSSATAQGSLVYNQSGVSVVNVGMSSATTASRALFEIFNAGSSFTMSGGTLSLQREVPSGSLPDLYLQPISGNVTGGAVEVGTGTTSQAIDVNTTIPLFNMNVAGTTNTARLVTNALILRGSLSINAGNIFNANALNVSIAGNFSNANTDASTGTGVGGYRPGGAAQTTTFNGTAGSQTITGVASNLTNFANLVINNSFSGGSISLQPNSSLRVNGNLTLTAGTFSGAANTITVIGNVSNSSTHTSTTGSITLGGSSTQLVTGNGSGKFGNLTLSNGNGAVFGASQEVTGILTFVNGTLTIGSYALNLSNTSLTAISGATSARYIVTSGNLSDGGVTKAFASGVTGGNFIYPIGVTGKYTPADYTITTGGSGGTITVRPVNNKHPNATGLGTSFIRYYWSVTSNAIIVNALTQRYTYVAADEAGTPANYRDARFKGGAWTIGITAGNPNTTTRVITFTNTDVASDYTAGEPTAFVNPTTYTSIASGNWESDLSVWDVDPPGTGIGPPQGSFVIISPGHTVTISTDTRRAATMDIRGRLHLGTTVSHDFGTVSTSGAGDRTMQLQSSIFPAGDFSGFTAAGGGTVEYDGTVNLSSTQAVYNNLSFTSSGVKTLANVDLTLNGNFTINSGTVTNATNNRTIYLANSTGDFTNRATFIAGTGPIIVGRDLINTGSAAVFNGSNGSQGLIVGRDLTNSTNATFLAGSDSIGIRGTLTNNGAFAANAGAIRITGNLSNASGTFNAGSGIININGVFTNNAVFNASTGAISVRSNFANTGASASYNANTSSLSVGGDITLGLGSTLSANTSSVFTTGNWSNSGTFNAGTGTVTFGKATAQSITGPTTFYNLNNTNGGSLILNDNVTVSNLLTLSSGNIITGSHTLNLTNTATQPVSGYSALAYIDGAVATSYPNTASASREFPIGKGSIYRPVTIQQTTTSSSPVVRVEMINTPPSGSYPVEVGILSTARYYSIDLLSGTMNSPTIDLSFNTNGIADESVVTPSNARIMRSVSPGGPWTNEGGSGVFDPADPAGHATSGVTTIDNPTYFTLGYQNQVLPITLQFFEAILKSDYVELNWATTTEINNDYFTIERSDESLQFDSISTVKGAGNSNVLLHYADLDRSPLGGISYYRLKQTDFDFRYTYSKVVRIVNSGMQYHVMSLYPNPSKGNEQITLKVTDKQAVNSNVIIADVTGRIYYSGQLDLTKGVDLKQIQLTYSLQPGVYIVRVAWENSVETRTFIVE